MLGMRYIKDQILKSSPDAKCTRLLKMQPFSVAIANTLIVT